MSEPQRNPDPADPLHYQILCGLALGFVFVVLLDQAFLLGNLLVGSVGVLAIVARMRIGPLLFLAVLTLSQAAPALGFRGVPPALVAPEGTLSLDHIILAAAVLVYVTGLLRLQAIWHNILPIDPRQRAGTPRRRFPWFSQAPPVVAQQRPPGSLTRREIGNLLLAVPLWVGLAQALWLVLDRPRGAFDIPTRLWQVLIVAWGLIIGFFLANQALLLWKRRTLSEPAALQLLQEVLWKETRGDQRRVQRWLAWWRVRQREKASRKKN